MQMIKIVHITISLLLLIVIMNSTAVLCIEAQILDDYFSISAMITKQWRLPDYANVETPLIQIDD